MRVAGSVNQMPRFRWRIYGFQRTRHGRYQVAQKKLQKARNRKSNQKNRLQQEVTVVGVYRKSHGISNLIWIYPVLLNGEVSCIINDSLQKSLMRVFRKSHLEPCSTSGGEILQFLSGRFNTAVTWSFVMKFHSCRLW